MEFPVFFKYKSQRFNNNRMFVTAGATPMYSTRNQLVIPDGYIALTGKDLTVDFSMGFDLYFKFFKLSPEIKFSHGINDIYYEEGTDVNFKSSISEIRRKTISIIFNFQ